MSRMQATNPAMSVVRLIGQGNRIVGVGFLISDENVLTCAHVVNTALGRDPRAQSRPPSSETVVVEFPTLGGQGRTPSRRSHVVEWHAPPAERRFEFGDIACLTLHELRPAEAIPAMVGIPPADTSLEALVFGYPSDPPRPEGAWIHCKLAPGVGGGFLQLDAASALGLRAQPGYSGSPVWLKERGVVVGMLALAPSAGETKDAYAIPARDFSSIYRQMSGNELLESPEILAAQQLSRALSIELGLWRDFISDQAEAGWIDHMKETPATEAWHEYQDFLAIEASESAAGIWRPDLIMDTLKRVYGYFESLIRAHNILEGRETPYMASGTRAELGVALGQSLKASLPSGISALAFRLARSRGIPYSQALALVVTPAAFAAQRMAHKASFRRTMRRVQLKDPDFQQCLQALPQALDNLIHDFNLLGTEPPSKRSQRKNVELPKIPRVSHSGQWFSFSLVGLKDYRA